MTYDIHTYPDAAHTYRVIGTRAVTGPDALTYTIHKCIHCGAHKETSRPTT